MDATDVHARLPMCTSHARVSHSQVKEQVWPQPMTQLFKMLLLTVGRLDAYIARGQLECSEGWERFEAIGEVDVVHAATEIGDVYGLLVEGGVRITCTRV